MKRSVTILGSGVLSLALGHLTSDVHADELTLGASASVDADQGSADESYLYRYAPTANLLEIGAFTGLAFISDVNSFRGSPTNVDGAPAARPFSEYNQPAAELGARVAYFPLSFLGAELEGMFSPARTSRDESATVLAGRTHLIVQAPLWSIVPFALGGAGYWASFNDTSGDDSDPAFHYGGGVKVAATGDLAFRLDIRDTVTNKRPLQDYPNHTEVQVGATFVLGRPDPAPSDMDGDGILPPDDQCPSEVGPAPLGCPMRDRDSDQIFDADDRCPDEPGLAPTGCPARDGDNDGVPDADDQCASDPGPAPQGCPDRDGDKVLDNTDQCPDEPGLFPLGCPGDTDQDGFLDHLDKCPDKAETNNGFEDTDGCPDELPEAVKKFTGVISGIEFDVNRDTIRTGSFPTLDQAVAVLNEYKDLRVEIVGHTDDTGARAHNLALSTRRAEAVRTYLISKGISSDRISAVGAGPDQPLVPEKSAAARQKNRRIEFHIVK